MAQSMHSGTSTQLRNHNASLTASLMYCRQGVEHNWSLLAAATARMGAIPMLLTVEDLLSRYVPACELFS